VWHLQDRWYGIVEYVTFLFFYFSDKILLELLLCTMPFKIVQTIEKGRSQLCIVPNLWEHKGLLRYPKKISDNKLARNENSKPQPDWRCMDCTVKRGSLSSYEQAEYELSIMLQNSDTDNIVTEQREKQNQASAHQIDYNTLAECLVSNFIFIGNIFISIRYWFGSYPIKPKRC
jgi:hypothetical protein